MTDQCDPTVRPEASARPLYAPVSRDWYAAYERGEYRSVLRRYGPHWNERTCPIGRAVTLSCVEGNHRRLRARIRAFHKRRGGTFGSTYRAHIQRTFGTLDLDIAEIRIELEESQ